MTDSHRTPVGRRALLRRGLLATGAVALGPTLLSALPDLDGSRLVRAAGQVGRVGAAAVAGAAPPIVTRAEWGADEALRSGTPSFATVRKAVVHHTDTVNGDRDPRARLRSILEFHTRYRGWNDIGYNFLIDAEGVVYEGRWARAYAPGEVHSGADLQGRSVIGAHAAGHNTGSVGVALLGTYTGVGPTDAALTSLVDVLAWKLGLAGVDPLASDLLSGEVWPNIAGHRDVVATGCPGTGLYALLPDIRREVAARLQQGEVGYRILSRDGGVTPHGAVGRIGDLRTIGLSGAPVRGLASTPSGLGFWIVGPDGGIFSFGDAPFHGSMGGSHLNRPMFGLAPTPRGDGYWTVASDGGIFSFGRAPFLGSTGGIALHQPIVGMSSTPSGHGYWLVAADGGVFSFGDAPFLGSTGGASLPRPVVGMAPTPSGHGYWLARADGLTYAYGDAPDVGGPPLASAGRAPVRAIRSTATGQGFWLLDADGGVFTYGDARFFGAGGPAPGAALDLAPVVRR